jgi:hypothetical protein
MAHRSKLGKIWQGTEFQLKNALQLKSLLTIP